MSNVAKSKNTSRQPAAPSSVPNGNINASHTAARVAPAPPRPSTANQDQTPRRSATAPVTRTLPTAPLGASSATTPAQQQQATQRNDTVPAQQANPRAPLGASSVPILAQPKLPLRKKATVPAPETQPRAPPGAPPASTPAQLQQSTTPGVKPLSAPRGGLPKALSGAPPAVPPAQAKNISTPQTPGTGVTGPTLTAREEELLELVAKPKDLCNKIPQATITHITKNTTKEDRERMMRLVAEPIEDWLKCLESGMFQVNCGLKPGNLVPSLVSASLKSRVQELMKPGTTTSATKPSKRGISLVYFFGEEANYFEPFRMARSLLVQLLRYVPTEKQKEFARESPGLVKYLAADLDPSYVEDSGSEYISLFIAAIGDIVKDLLPRNTVVYIVIDGPERVDALAKHSIYKVHRRLAFCLLGFLADEQRLDMDAEKNQRNGAAVKLLFVCAQPSNYFDKLHVVAEEDTVKIQHLK